MSVHSLVGVCWAHLCCSHLMLQPVKVGLDDIQLQVHLQVGDQVAHVLTQAQQLTNVLRPSAAALAPTQPVKQHRPQ